MSTTWWVAAPLALALASACSDDDPGPAADGSGGKSAGGASTGGKAAGSGGGSGAGGATGGRASGGAAPAGGTPSSGGGDASGGVRDASVDAPSEGGEPDASWPECPTTGVDGGARDGGAHDGGASPYPACTAPPTVGAHEVNVFPAGVYELQVHALSGNTGGALLDPVCFFAQGTAKVQINVVAHRPCCGEACLQDPSTEIVVTLSRGTSGRPSVGRTSATDADIFDFSWDDARDTSRVTVNRATGGIVARGDAWVRGGGGSDGFTYWEGVGSLACSAAPAHSAPPPFPNGLPLTGHTCSDAPLTPPQNWDASCTWTNRFRPPNTSCAANPPVCPQGNTLTSCTDASSSDFDFVCCPP